MKKQTKVICWLAGICCLLPAIVGLVLYSRLPDQVAVHWGFGGEPNGFMHKFGACFGIPLLTAALYGVMIAVTWVELRRKKVSQRVMRGIVWIFPAVSWVASGAIYCTAMGIALRIDLLSMILLGTILILLGNYLPKCRPNGVIGFRCSWTFSSESVWEKTHLLAGRLFVVCGVLIILFSFWQLWVVSLVLLLAALLIPCVYAGVLYHREQKNS